MIYNKALTDDELIGALRTCEIDIGAHCRKCVAYNRRVGGCSQLNILVTAAERFAEHKARNWTDCWISVEDRLPEDDALVSKDGTQLVIKVLVVIKNKNGLTIRTRIRSKLPNDIWEWKYFEGGVTHWMPLPEPPEESR